MLKLFIFFTLLGVGLGVLAWRNIRWLQAYQRQPEHAGYFVTAGKIAHYVQRVPPMPKGEGAESPAPAVPSVLVFVGEEPAALWSPWQEAFAKRYPQQVTLVYDRASRGWSGHGALVPPQQAAQQAWQLAQALHTPAPYVCVGNGYGALVAAHFAHQYQHHTQGLVLVEPYVAVRHTDPDIDYETYQTLFNTHQHYQGAILLARLGLARMTPLPPYLRRQLPKAAQRHWHAHQANPRALAANRQEHTTIAPQAFAALDDASTSNAIANTLATMPVQLLASGPDAWLAHFPTNQLIPPQREEAIAAREHRWQAYYPDHITYVSQYPAYLHAAALNDTLAHFFEPAS